MEALTRDAIYRGAGAAVARQGIAIQARRGRSILLPPNKRCVAVVFLAANGHPQRCRFRRHDGVFCSRHQRERTGAF
jgi:hypothetical protein